MTSTEAKKLLTKMYNLAIKDDSVDAYDVADFARAVGLATTAIDQMDKLAEYVRRYKGE